MITLPISRLNIVATLLGSNPIEVEFAVSSKIPISLIIGMNKNIYKNVYLLDIPSMSLIGNYVLPNDCTYLSLSKFPYLLHSTDGSNIISKHCCSALHTALLSEEYIKWYRVLTQWIRCLNTLIPLEEVYKVIEAHIDTHINTYVIPNKESSLPLSLTLLIDKYKSTSIDNNSPPSLLMM